MSTKNFINFHVLISHSPSCLNRDDMNMQKTAVFGGVNRVRVSSQSLKRSMRTSDYYESHLGTASTRTRELEKLIPIFTEALKDEFEPALIRLDQGIRSVNEGMPSLDRKTLIRGGFIGVQEAIGALNDKRIELFESFYASSLIDVSGAAKLLRLSFSLLRWIETTLQTLTCCSPISDEGAQTEEQTVIAASGNDLAVVRQILARSPHLAFVEAVASDDSKMIVLHRRIEGLTIEAIPTFQHAKREASAFPRQEHGLRAWQTLAANGYVLGAYEQAGIVPDHWLPKPMAPSDRQLILERVEHNGDGH